jgi:hypothetical protein
MFIHNILSNISLIKSELYEYHRIRVFSLCDLCEEAFIDLESGYISSEKCFPWLILRIRTHVAPVIRFYIGQIRRDEE